MTDILISLLNILFCVVILIYRNKLINPILTWNYKSKINGYKTELVAISPFEIFIIIQMLLTDVNSFFFYVYLILAIILMSLKLILFGYSLYLALQDDRASYSLYQLMQNYRASAYSRIKSFLEQRIQKKHYPYYYIIKYDFVKIQCYSYKASLIIDNLRQEYKQHQDLNILKMELKIYGDKYYFNSWDDLFLAVEMNKIRGMESNNQ